MFMVHLKILRVSGGKNAMNNIPQVGKIRKKQMKEKYCPKVLNCEPDRSTVRSKNENL